MILEELNNISNINEQKTALIIRHADRDNAPIGSLGNDVLLNDVGIKHAKEFGCQLRNYKINKIYTSPIERCIQTATLMNESLHNKVKIIKTNKLGDPGFHVTNAKKAELYYQKYSCQEIYDLFVQDRNIDGIASKEELQKKGMSFFKSKTQEKGITLFITHDALIAHFAHANDIKYYSKDNWVDFLDGFSLK